MLQTLQSPRDSGFRWATKPTSEIVLIEIRWKHIPSRVVYTSTVPVKKRNEIAADLGYRKKYIELNTFYKLYRVKVVLQHREKSPKNPWKLTFSAAKRHVASNLADTIQSVFFEGLGNFRVRRRSISTRSSMVQLTCSPMGIKHLAKYS